MSQSGAFNSNSKFSVLTYVIVKSLVLFSDVLSPWVKWTQNYKSYMYMQTFES